MNLLLNYREKTDSQIESNQLYRFLVRGCVRTLRYKSAATLDFIGKCVGDKYRNHFELHSMHVTYLKAVRESRIADAIENLILLHQESYPFTAKQLALAYELEKRSATAPTEEISTPTTIVLGPKLNREDIIQKISRFHFDSYIFTKPPVDIIPPKHSTLFLNNHTYRRASKSQLAIWANQYKEVVLPPDLKSKHPNFRASRGLPETSPFASPMGLARVIYDQNVSNPEQHLFITGFDAYTSFMPYGGGIQSIFLSQDVHRRFKGIRKSLLDHDFLYNFILLKYLLNNPRISLDDRLKEIMAISVENYYKIIEYLYG